MNNSAQHRSSAGIIFFALGLTSALNDEAPNAPLVLAVAAELGMPESACRAAILRLRRDGQLVSERIGRSARYSPTPAVSAAQRRWTTTFRDGPSPWDGTFSGLLHDFPERDRSRRDRFRRVARLTGYELLRPGLLISPDDRWADLAHAFTADERVGRILRIGLTLRAGDAAQIARDLWDLDRLADRYRQLVQGTERALADPSVPASSPPSAIARLYQTTQPIYEAIAQDPALPTQLLPSDWPAHDLGAALTAANQALAPAAVAQLRTINAGR